MDTLGEADRHETGADVKDFDTSIIDESRSALGIRAGRSRICGQLVPDARYRATAVHVLDTRGTVVTLGIEGTDTHGNELQWARTCSWVFDEARVEVYEDDDIDVALRRFEEMRPQEQRLKNAATKVEEHFQACFAARDWAAMGEILADDISADDRRRVVNAGIRHGREAKIADMRATADLGTKSGTSTVIAIRGQRLALVRIRLSGRDQRPDAFHTEMLGIAEIDAHNRMTARILFDVDDIDAAFTELDSRYLAGEAAAHADMWSVLTQAHAAFKRHELPTTTPDWVNLDHRRATAFAPGEAIAYVRAGWDLDQVITTCIEEVHRLNELGAVFSWAGHGTSQAGFDAEWRGVNILTVEGGLISRTELFDEADLAAAIAKFDELSCPTARLENAAVRVVERFPTCFATRDWDAMAELYADDFVIDDRRRVVNAGIRHGREAEIEDLRAAANVGFAQVTWVVIATRGERLVLTRARFSGRDERPDAFAGEVLHVVEIDADERIAAVVVFDLEDIDAAFEELDARYVAGEAADHARTWSVIAAGYAALNRHEFPAPTEDYVNIDHRLHATIAAGDLSPYLTAAWDLVPDLVNYIDAVHRLSDLGAVLTHTARGTSHEGFGAEWRMIELLSVKNDMVSRSEIFDETDLDAALARFEELSHPAPRLENTASRVCERFESMLCARDWDAITEMLAEDVSNDDRRRVVNAGIRRGRNAVIAEISAIADVGVTTWTSDVIATRGDRLVLVRPGQRGNDERPEAFQGDVLRSCRDRRRRTDHGERHIRR